ncbi:MAG: TetR family transcriptional regulator C-terminal domain-containing protein [Clostridiales bacterium]|nr:TetR family transcriptional regulator C-terminal domain-containing protein [Clostridiales bacterium]
MALLTKGAIMSTFEEMLSEMTFDKITVSALVKRSRISPNTFYYHYQDKYALLNEWFGTKLRVIRNDVDVFSDWQNKIKVFFYMCRDNPKLIHHVIDSVSREQLEHYIFEITDVVFLSYVRQKTEGRGVTDKKVREIARFYTYSFIGFFLEFIWDDMEDDIEEKVDNLSKLFDAFIEGAIRV